MQNKPMRHPNCPTPRHCVITFEGSNTTLLAWSPVFDGNGNLLNVNPNDVEAKFDCDTCGRKWIRKTLANEETFVMLN